MIISAFVSQAALYQTCSRCNSCSEVGLLLHWANTQTQTVKVTVGKGKRSRTLRKDRQCRKRSVYKAEQKGRRTLVWICGRTKLPSGATWPAHPAKASGAQAYLCTHKQLCWRRHCGMTAGAASERDSSHSLLLSPCKSKSPIFKPRPAAPPNTLPHSFTVCIPHGQEK